MSTQNPSDEILDDLQLAVTSLTVSSLLDSEQTAVITPLVEDVCRANKRLLDLFKSHGWDPINNQFMGPVNMSSLALDMSKQRQSELEIADFNHAFSTCDLRSSRTDSDKECQRESRDIADFNSALSTWDLCSSRTDSNKNSSRFSSDVLEEFTYASERRPRQTTCEPDVNKNWKDVIDYENPRFSLW